MVKTNKAVEIILTSKRDIKTARKVKQLLHSANQCFKAGSIASFELWTSRANAKKNELVKNNGLLAYGTSSKELYIAISDDCERVIVLH